MPLINAGARKLDGSFCASAQANDLAVRLGRSRNLRTGSHVRVAQLLHDLTGIGG